MILEAVYEPIFSHYSHGFRPNRSCHTALYQIKSTCRGTNWVIEGDITGCFDNIDHEILLKILSKKIRDGRFLELIRKFLKAGYLEFKQKQNSISGTPQGGLCYAAHKPPNAQRLKMHSECACAAGMRALRREH